MPGPRTTGLHGVVIFVEIEARRDRRTLHNTVRDLMVAILVGSGPLLLPEGFQCVPLSPEGVSGSGEGDIVRFVVSRTTPPFTCPLSDVDTICGNSPSPSLSVRPRLGVSHNPNGEWFRRGG